MRLVIILLLIISGSVSAATNPYYMTPALLRNYSVDSVNQTAAGTTPLSTSVVQCLTTTTTFAVPSMALIIVNPGPGNCYVDLNGASPVSTSALVLTSGSPPLVRDHYVTSSVTFAPVTTDQLPAIRVHAEYAR